MRENIPSWHEYHVGNAEHAAKRSKDPSTQVGCVIVDDNNHVVMTGYNGFPPGIAETNERWQRPEKYRWVIHAEMNAIGHAAKKGVSLDGCSLYVTHFPCNDCAKMIVASGIQKVYVGYFGLTTAQINDGGHRQAFELLHEAGVRIWWHRWLYDANSLQISENNIEYPPF